MPFSIEITNTQIADITVVPKDAADQVALVDGKVRATVVSGNGTVEAATDAAPLTFGAVSFPGALEGEVTVYDIAVDKIVGEGESLLNDTVTVTIKAQPAPLAETLGFSANVREKV